MKPAQTPRSIEPHKLVHCSMCKAPIWIPVKQEVHVLGIICSERCQEDYEDLRRDGHWV